MYSYEDRIRAVKLYIKLGKRVAATIHQQGYPTQNALKSWHRTYELGSGLPRAYVRTKPKYSQVQQTLALEHYLAHGRCIAATIKALSYPSRDSLRAWILAVHPQLCSPGVVRPDTSPRPPELKQAAVIALCTRQESAQAVAQKLGVCRPTLYNWKNQLLSPETSASMTSKPKPPQPDEREELQRQIDALRRDPLYHSVRRPHLRQLKSEPFTQKFGHARPRRHLNVHMTALSFLRWCFVGDEFLHLSHLLLLGALQL
ncbi:MAG: transposase [Burkholderiales bacterium]|nr:transposase [Burkholderiales bacterium]